MKESPRLDRVQKHLSSLQIAMLDIKAAHRHGSLVGYSRALASEREKPIWSEAIETTTRARCRGMSKDEVRDAMLATQKDVGFLHRLAVETWSSVATNQRAWMADATASKLAHALVLEMVECGRVTTDDLTTAVESWQAFVDSHLNELLTEVEAVRLIEREYFQGASIMFENDEMLLSGLIAEARGESTVVAGAKAALEKCKSAPRGSVASRESRSTPNLAERATALANERADMARAYVLDSMSEHRDAKCLLQGIMHRVELDDSS